MSSHFSFWPNTCWDFLPLRCCISNYSMSQFSLGSTKMKVEMASTTATSIILWNLDTWLFWTPDILTLLLYFSRVPVSSSIHHSLKLPSLNRLPTVSSDKIAEVWTQVTYMTWTRARLESQIWWLKMQLNNIVKDLQVDLDFNSVTCGFTWIWAFWLENNWDFNVYYIKSVLRINIFPFISWIN